MMIRCIAPVRHMQALFLLILILLSGCSVSPSPQTESLDYHARSETKVDHNISVSAVVLSPSETEERFGLPLADKGVQPLWVKIENRSDKQYYLMLLSIDPDYFSPSEVAWMFRSRQKKRQENGEGEEAGGFDDKNEMFLNHHIPVIVPPNTTVSGYVYTNLDPGAKAFAVELFGENDTLAFEFVQLVPGFDADFMRVDFDRIYPENEIKELDFEGLRSYLETLPCCVLGGDKKTPGDPLNLVIVGDGEHVLATLIRRGWDLTETMHGAAMWSTVFSSLFGSAYRTSPVSALYLFDRPQDIALQKARSTVDERNHLRLWKAPVTIAGEPVWVGQISRDIGVKFTSKTFVTHKIDPVVDEARLYITLDFAASQTLQAVGYVKGVGRSDRENPRYNYTDDPFYTDGLRVVLMLGEKRVPLDKIDYLRWEKPTGRKKYLEDGQ